MKKVLFSSILTIALCLSLIAGSTFALFTDEQEYTISANSATVDFTATILKDTLALKTLMPSATYEDPQGDEPGEDAAKFENGGTAFFDGELLKLNLMTPGDHVTFNIKLVNNSNVDVKYNVTKLVTGGTALVNALQISVKEGATDATNYIDWATTDSNEKILTVTVWLPENAGNECQHTSATIDFTVFAVQGNG